jgi:MFS superfamily sulfate permease-like transporter
VNRLDDRLFFANASYVKGRVQEALHGAPTVTTALVLDAEAMTHVDAAGLQALKDLAGTLKDNGIALHFARAKQPIADRLAERVDRARSHGTVRAAVHAAVRDQTETPVRSSGLPRSASRPRRCSARRSSPPRWASSTSRVARTYRRRPRGGCNRRGEHGRRS